MHEFIWIVAAASIVLVLARPLRIGEWVWPVAGAALLVAVHALSGRQAASAAHDGLEVYAFLLGMLALAELARAHGLFDALATLLAQRTNGNTAQLFGWWFAGAVAVTAFLSNDGAIVLLTPAALALARSAQLQARPFAYAVAFVANAASFIFPISNPANLVVFSPLPQLARWLVLFAAPSAFALLVTYVVLRIVHARDLRDAYETPRNNSGALSRSARLTLIVVACALGVLIVAAGLGWPVGYVAFALGIVCTLIVALVDRSTPLAVARNAPWSIIPLIAGLFVIVRALDSTGALELARTLFRNASAMPPVLGRLYAGGVVTLADALINNLPAGVIVRYAVHAHGISPQIAHAVLVGIDLGPNLSISGSLATLLWVMMLRREGVAVNAWRFLQLGALVTVPSLALSLLAGH